MTSAEFPPSLLADSLCATTDRIRVGEIVRPRLVECGPELPLWQAAQRMAESKVSSILVVEAGQAVGIWTERDTLAVDFEDPLSFERPVGEVMSSPVRTVSAEISLHELTMRFRQERVRHYLVVNEDGSARGVVSQSDAVLNQGVEHYLKLRKVDSLVTGDLRLLPAATPLPAITTWMREGALDAVVVDFGAAAGSENERYGIITERDLARTVASRSFKLRAGDIASRPLATVSQHASLYRLRTLLMERGYRHIGVLHDNGELIGLISFSDILAGIELAYVRELREALHERDRALTSSERGRYLAEKIIEVSLEGIVVTDADANILSVNPAFSRVTGYAPEEVIGRNPCLLASGRHDTEFYAQMWGSLRESGTWQGEIWNRRKSGEIYPELLHITTIYDSDGTIAHYVAVFTDISRIKDNERRIRELAYYDPLTGLPNRRLLEDRLQVALAHADRSKRSLAAMFVDLDRFKRINDSLGHEVGDRLLIEVAQRLRSCLREEDTVARVGGDEFLILLSNLLEADYVAITARRVIEALRKPVLIDGMELMVTTSIGISIYPADAHDGETLIRNADAAMYRAKDLGRDSFQLYESAMNARSLERLALETALHHALSRDELTVHLQPVIECSSGNTVAAEVLLRWKHPDLGLVPPADFIPIAEITGLIVPIGEWVLRRAGDMHREWRDAGRGPLRMMVNISARQFRDPDFFSMVRRALADTAMSADDLILEVTESILMDSVQHSIELLDSLHALGVGLAVDDFGTGYSSLAYLKRFPIDELKIDRLFVRDVDRSARDAALVGATIALGHSLDLRVVAEGVETAAQHKVLGDYGCDLLQGFHFSRPLPWADFLAFTRSGER